jgi:hypothetical protein
VDGAVIEAPELEELEEPELAPFVVPIGPGAESVRIELWAGDPAAGSWDRATWDGGKWAAVTWQSVGCDVGEAVYRWGASQEAGILSLAEAGELDLNTIDPGRHLDPLNTAGPFYGYVKPGSPLRILGLAPSSIVAWTGYVDEASYDLASGRGRIRAVDTIAYLGQAQLPDGAVLPNTLRARVRAIVAAAGLGSRVTVEPEAPSDPDIDPPVAPHDLKSKPAWQAITDAATDALVLVWADPTGVLRFRSWGALIDAPFAGVGCPPDDADAGDVWLEGLSTLDTTASADAIRNRVRAWSAASVWQPPAVDGISIDRYGPRPFDLERVVPDYATWAGRILADRADAGLEVAIGELRPYTSAELEALLAAQLAGPCIVRVRDDAHGELIDLDLGMIGAQVGVTPGGWRFALVSMLSRVEWDAITPTPPVEPPIPPPDPWHTETRTYVASSDALIALTSGGAKYGAGASTSLPIGTWQGWTYRGLLKFPSIPWSKVRAIRSATLKLTTSSQVRVGFGSSPKTQLRRITGSWSAGASSSPSSGNAVVWPGPATTTSGAVTSALPTGQGAGKSIRCDAIVRAWAPSAIGGTGATQQGIALYEASGSGSNTSEVWPVEQGGASRPTLELVLEVFD